MCHAAGDGLRTITQCRGYFQCHAAVETGLLRLDFKYDNKAGTGAPAGLRTITTDI